VSDTGLLAHLLGVDERGLAHDHAAMGQLLETFVVMELLRQAGWQKEPVRLFRYRDKDGREVDVIMESLWSGGQVVAGWAGVRPWRRITSASAATSGGPPAEAANTSPTSRK
jgi:hypothetical protein